MSRGINKVILVGHLGQDPEVKYLSGGGAVANVSIATSEQWRDKQTGETRDRTEWHRVVFYKRLAEIVGEYLRKGSQVYIEGRLQTRKWQDASGADRYTTEIIAHDMHMLGARGDAQSAGSPPSAPTHGHGGGQSPQPANSTHDGYNPFDDDIPF